MSPASIASEEVGVFPRRGSSTFLPAFGRVREHELELMRGLGVRGWAQPVTVPVPDVPGTLLDVPMTKVLLPSTEFNGRHPDRRPAGHGDLGYPFGSAPYRVSRGVLSADLMYDYVGAVLGVQAERGASLLLTPAHFVGGMNSVGRRNDLEMAAISRRVAVRDGLDQPDADDPWALRRPLFAYALIPIRALSGSAGEELLAAYAGLDVDGYWIGVDAFDERSSSGELYAAACWLFELEQRTDKPVASYGAGNLHLAFLLEGLACASVRVDARPLLPWPRAATRRPRRRRVFHPVVLAEVYNDRRGMAERTHAEMLFAMYECDCDQHDAGVPPVGEQTVGHTLICRTRLAQHAARGGQAQRATPYASILNTAKRVARSLDLNEVDLSGWDAVQAAAGQVGRRADRATG